MRLPTPWRLSVRTKLIVSFVLVLIPTLVLLLWQNRQAMPLRIQGLLTEHAWKAMATGVLVEAAFDSALALAGLLATDPVVQTFDPQRIDPYFERLAALYPEYESIAVWDASGLNVGSVPPYLYSEAAGSRPSIADQDYFQQAMATNRPVVSGVKLGRLIGRPTVIVAVPVRDQSGQPVGVLTVALKLEALQERLIRSGLVVHEAIWLVDPGGRLAFATDRPDLTWEERWVGDFPPVREVIERGGRRLFEALPRPLDGQWLGAFVATPRYRWIVGAMVPVAQALAPFEEAARVTLAVFLGAALLTGLLIYRLASGLVWPIRRLRDHAQALGRGELGQRVEVRTGDELEELGQAFNTMAAQLAQTMGHLRALLDAVDSGILAYDREGDVRLVSRRLGEWFELDPQAVIGQPVTRLIQTVIGPKLAHPERLVAIYDWLRDHPDEVVRYEIVQVRPVFRIFRYHSDPIREDQTIIGRADLFVDITELRRREEEREALGQVAQALVRELTLERVAEVVAAEGQRVLGARAVGVWLFESAQQELRLVAYRGFNAEIAAEVQRFPLSAPMIAAYAARLRQPVEVTDLLQAGPDIVLSRRLAEQAGMRAALAQPLLARGRLVGVLTILLDTPRSFTRRERALIQAFADLCAVAIENARLYEEVRSTLRLREEFLSVAAHELKTPITALRGYVQLLLRQRAALPPESQDLLAAIERQTRRLTRLIEDLLETVSPPARPLRRQVLDLAALTERVLREAVRLSPRHRLLLCRPGPVLVSADPDLLERVLLTLVDNAIRFSPDGGRVEVTISIEGDQAVVAVRDHGLGIPRERQPHVFEPFFEPYPPGTPGYTGVTGLGLYVAKLIVERHGGRIWFTSEEGKGSTFFISLPLASPPAAPA